MCRHPMSVCRDPRTEGQWTVATEVCQAGRVALAVAESAAESGVRGLHIMTKRTEAS